MLELKIDSLPAQRSKKDRNHGNQNFFPSFIQFDMGKVYFLFLLSSSPLLSDIKKRTKWDIAYGYVPNVTRVNISKVKFVFDFLHGLVEMKTVLLLFSQAFLA